MALELGDSGEENGRGHLSGGEGEGGYGKEVDWWSLGAMIYEVAFGVAPFFANDIRQTYAKIIAHNVCDVPFQILTLLNHRAEQPKVPT